MYDVSKKICTTFTLKRCFVSFSLIIKLRTRLKGKITFDERHKSCRKSQRQSKKGGGSLSVEKSHERMDA